MKDNILKIKSKDFAIRVIKLCRYLKNEKHEFEIAHQIIKSGTSIGANISEAEFAQSKLDFISKMHIALKEASETLYWLELLYSIDSIDEKSFISISTDCKEIIKILVNAIKTTKANLLKENDSLKKNQDKSNSNNDSNFKEPESPYYSRLNILIPTYIENFDIDSMDFLE